MEPGVVIFFVNTTIDDPTLVACTATNLFFFKTEVESFYTMTIPEVTFGIESGSTGSTYGVRANNTAPLKRGVTRI